MLQIKFENRQNLHFRYNSSGKNAAHHTIDTFCLYRLPIIVYQPKSTLINNIEGYLQNLWRNVRHHTFQRNNFEFYNVSILEILLLVHQVYIVRIQKVSSRCVNGQRHPNRNCFSRSSGISFAMAQSSSNVIDSSWNATIEGIKSFCKEPVLE